MGYYFILAPCVACRVPFSFNPEKVPSHRRTPGGPREPICRACVTRANPLRKEKGLEEIQVLPGAYKFATEGID